jgi:hypothetical protein
MLLHGLLDGFVDKAAVRMWPGQQIAARFALRTD